MNKNIYHFRKWEGVDTNNVTSLFVYGFLHNPKAKVNEFNIVYGIEMNESAEYIKFAYTTINWEELISASWIKWEEVCAFAGCDKSEFNTFSCMNVSTLISYYGIENILGMNYDFGFTINGRKSRRKSMY